jgi:hypothetical protein
MDVNKANKPIDSLPNSKRNKIIIELSLYSYKDSYVKYSRNVKST